MSPLVMGTVAVVALFFSGLFNTIEAALAVSSKARVAQIAKEKSTRAARRLLIVLDHRAEHINLLILGQKLLDATAAVFTAMLAMEWLSPRIEWALAAAIGGVTLLSFVIVGVFSRTIGRQNPYTVSLVAAFFLRPTFRILNPISKVLIGIGNILAPGRGFQDGPYSTEVELKEMVEIAQSKGEIEVDSRMVQNVFDLSDSIAREVMVPRPDMVWIESGKLASQALNLCIKSGHSRIPVIGESVDDIVGVVYLKDVVQRMHSPTKGDKNPLVDEVMRTAHFVPDSKRLDDLLDEMQRERFHIALLVDEFGGVAGLISIEDILEEIVGEITDEYDSAEITPIVQDPNDPYKYLVVSRLQLDDLVERIEDDHHITINFDPEILDQIDTVAGLIAYEKGRVPLPNTEVETSGLRLKAIGGRDRRGRISVREVDVTMLVRGDDAEESDHNPDDPDDMA